MQKIHKNIFQYLWQIKIPEPITRKTLFLPKNKGGLNIKESEGRNLSIHIKRLLTLKDQEKQPPWMSIGTYWLEEDNYNKEFHHLKNNSITKTNKRTPLLLGPNILYKNPTSQTCKNKTKIIYKNIP